MQLIETSMQAEIDAGADRLRPLARYPQLVGAPVIMAAVWNGLWSADAKLDPAEMFHAFLQVVFGEDEAQPSDGA